jgi:hypothetical protein
MTQATPAAVPLQGDPRRAVVRRALGTRSAAWAWNALARGWWANPVAALGMTPILVREGREAWRGEECGCA